MINNVWSLYASMSQNIYYLLLFTLAPETTATAKLHELPPFQIFKHYVLLQEQSYVHQHFFDIVYFSRLYLPFSFL